MKLIKYIKDKWLTITISAVSYFVILMVMRVFALPVEIVAIITFIKKLIFWDTFEAGVAAIGVGVFFLGSVQLFFIGLLGEYILNMNIRILHRPLVIEEERINFDNL